MSICLTLKCEERIVMAADSRSTRNGGSYIDGLRKCVWLEEEKLAFAFAGVNILDGIEITDFIRRKRNVFKRHDPVQAINDLNDLFYERIPEGERINVCCASFIDTPEAVYADFSNKTIVSPSIVTRLWNNGGDVIDKLFTDADRGLICPFISSYSELEAVRFLSYIIDTEEGYLEFLGKPNTVGGPRQFLILERGGICTERWIDKNKIW